MPNVGHQQFWLTGARLYFQRDPINSVDQPLIDLGVIEPVGPTTETQTAQLVDSDGGSNVVVAEEMISLEEMYEITCSNLNQDNLALLFSADEPSDYTQSATPVTTRVVYAHPGRLVKIPTSDNGVDAEVGLASVDAVTGSGGTPTYTEGTDWETVSLERGIIRMIAGGSFASAANIEIDFTRRAITAERRLVYPQTHRGTVEGTAYLFWGREDNEEQTMREMRVALSPSGSSFQNSEFSNWTLRLKVLADTTDTTSPAGRLLTWVGDLPSLS